MRARGAAQATVRVHGCVGGQGTSLKHGLAHPTVARAPAHLPTSPGPVRLTTRNIQAVCGETCTYGSEDAGRAARPARLPDTVVKPSPPPCQWLTNNTNCGGCCLENPGPLRIAYRSPSAPAEGG